MNIDLDIISWQYALLILVIFLFILWAAFGGGNYDYIGLSPLEIGYDASRNRKHGSVDNTPPIPDLEKINSESFSYEYPSVLCFSESHESFSESEEAMTPRSAALGPHKCRANGNLSKGERLCKQAVEEIYGLPFYCVRPDFLKNPETGRNLEIDIYNDQLKLGIEYNSKQHYIFPNSFHKTYEEFINQVRRDKYKVEMCDQNGVYLISVPYNVPLDLESIKNYIIYYLPENAHLREQDIL